MSWKKFIQPNYKLIPVLIFVFYSLSPNVLAQSKMESDNYTIQFPNLNSGAGVPTSTNYGVTSTIGGSATGLYSSSGFRVRSGFQYVKTIIPFSFSVSDIAINFGTLTLGIPATDQSTLTVKAGGAGGYSVTAVENHPMQNSALSEIPDILSFGILSYKTY